MCASFYPHPLSLVCVVRKNEDLPPVLSKFLVHFIKDMAIIYGQKLDSKKTLHFQLLETRTSSSSTY